MFQFTFPSSLQQLGCLDCIGDDEHHILVKYLRICTVIIIHEWYIFCRHFQWLIDTLLDLRDDLNFEQTWIKLKIYHHTHTLNEY